MSLWFGLRARCICDARRAERLTHDGGRSVELARTNCDESAEARAGFFNAEDAEGLAEDAELLTQEEIERVLHDLLEGLQEPGAYRAVNNAMIA